MLHPTVLVISTLALLSSTPTVANNMRRAQDCPDTPCSDKDDPVCASNHQTFRNECEFNKRACIESTKMTIIFNGSCDNALQNEDEASPSRRQLTGFGFSLNDAVNDVVSTIGTSDDNEEDATGINGLISDRFPISKTVENDLLSTISSFGDSKEEDSTGINGLVSDVWPQGGEISKSAWSLLDGSGTNHLDDSGNNDMSSDSRTALDSVIKDILPLYDSNVDSVLDGSNSDGSSSSLRAKRDDIMISLVSQYDSSGSSLQDGISNGNSADDKWAKVADIAKTLLQPYDSSGDSSLDSSGINDSETDLRARLGDTIKSLVAANDNSGSDDVFVNGKSTGVNIGKVVSSMLSSSGSNWQEGFADLLCELHGGCSEDSKDLKTSCDNLKACKTEHNPVCGSDLVTYSNKCELEVARCEKKADLKILKSEACDSTYANGASSSSGGSAMRDGAIFGSDLSGNSNYDGVTVGDDDSESNFSDIPILGEVTVGDVTSESDSSDIQSYGEVYAGDDTNESDAHELEYEVTTGDEKSESDTSDVSSLGIPDEVYLVNNSDKIGTSD